MKERLRNKNEKYFVDRPLKIDNKIVFDGEFFLGERYHFIVRNVISYLKGTTIEKYEDNYCYKVIPIKVRPNRWEGKKFKYTLWDRKIDEGTRVYGFDKSMIAQIKKNLYTYMSAPFCD